MVLKRKKKKNPATESISTALRYFGLYLQDRGLWDKKITREDALEMLCPMRESAANSRSGKPTSTFRQTLP